MKKNILSEESILIILLLLITGLGQLAIDIYLPSMPSMQIALLASKDLVQITLSVYTIGFGASQLVYGPLSDRFGRRKILFVGLALYTLATLGCIFVKSIDQLIFFRLLAGLGGGAASVLTRAVLRDRFTGNRMAQVAAYMSIAWSLIPILAPLLGSYIQQLFDWRGNFVFLFFAGFFTLIIIFRYLPDTNHDKRLSSLHPKIIVKNYWGILTHFTAMRFALIPMLTFACTISYATASPFLIENDLGFTPVAYGWLTLIVSLSYLLANIINTRVVHHYGKMRLIQCGVGCNLVGSLSMVVFATLGIFNIYTLLIPASIIIFAGGFLFANAMSSAMVPFITTAGTAAAIIGCIQMLGGSMASFIVAKLPFQTAFPLSILLLTLGIIMAITITGLKELQQDE